MTPDQQAVVCRLDLIVALLSVGDPDVEKVADELTRLWHFGIDELPEGTTIHELWPAVQRFEGPFEAFVRKQGEPLAFLMGEDEDGDVVVHLETFIAETRQANIRKGQDGLLL